MIKYVLLVAFGALSFGMLSSFAKIAYVEGYTPAEITFAQACFGAIALWLIVLVQRFKSGAKKLNLDWKFIIPGTCMGVSVYAYYLSVAYIPASLAIVLLMQMTWISILAEWLFNGKKPNHIEIISSIVIIFGTMLAGKIFNPNVGHISWLGVGLAFISAVLYAAFIFMTSNLAKDIPMIQKSAILTTGSALVIALINLKALTASVHLNIGLLKWGSFMAFFGTVIPPICFTKGMPKIGASLSSVILTLELPAAVFCAHIILKEPVSLIQILGLLIILCAIICSNLLKRKSEIIKDLDLQVV